jgi:hypothetical protein
MADENKNEETNFSAWADVDMTEKSEEISTENKETTEVEETAELGSEANSVNAENSSESKAENEEGEEVKTPEAILKEIAELPENKDKSTEELQSILEAKLNEDLEKEIVIGDSEDLKNPLLEDKEIKWGDIAKQLELVDEVGEDFKYENLKETIDKKIENEINKVKQEYSSFDQLNDVSKTFVKYMNEMGTESLKTFLNPLEQYDKLLSLPKDKLVEENFRAYKDEKGNQYYSEEDIAEKMLDLEENEAELKKEYDKIKLSLIDGRKNAEQILSERMEYELQEHQKQKQTQHIDSNLIMNELKSVNEFAGVKIAEKGKESLAKMIESKEVEKLLKDPKFLVNSIMFHKFGDEAIKAIRKVEYEKGKNKALSRQYNIPAINGGTPGAVAPTEKKSGTFADWGK